MTGQGEAEPAGGQGERPSPPAGGTSEEENAMPRYLCPTCRFLVDTGDTLPRPDGAPPLPDGWVCPVCGASSDALEALDERHAIPETRRDRS